MIIRSPVLKADVSDEVHFLGNIIVALVPVNILVREEVVVDNLR